MTTPTPLDSEALKVACALAVLREHEAKNKDRDAAFDRITDLMETIFATTQTPIRCKKCGSSQDLYVIVEK